MKTIKISDRKTFIRLISKMGYVRIKHRKHECWSNGDYKVFIPSKGKFSRPLYERLLNDCRANARDSEQVP